MLLEMRSLRAGYGVLPVLFDIDLSVQQGEMLSILGANGAGKSTLLKTILGAVHPTSGEITFKQERVTSMPAYERVQRGIALSPEGRQVFSTLTVRENLITGAAGVGGAQLQEQFDRVYQLFPRLHEREGQDAGSLSGGEQQMLAVSRALMSQPRLLLVDELSLGLAPVIVDRLYGALRDLCNEGLAVIMVEQFHLAAAGHADRELVLEKGEISGSGSTEINHAAGEPVAG